MEAEPKMLFGLEDDEDAGSKPKPYFAIGKAVFDGSGDALAAARTVEGARRIAATLNMCYGIATEAVEAWSVGRIQDPVNDLLAELETLLAPPISEERRRGDRRRGERRRAVSEVRIEASKP